MVLFVEYQKAQMALMEAAIISAEAEESLMKAIGKSDKKIVKKAEKEVELTTRSLVVAAKVFTNFARRISGEKVNR